MVKHLGSNIWIASLNLVQVTNYFTLFSQISKSRKVPTTDYILPDYIIMIMSDLNRGTGGVQGRGGRGGEGGEGRGGVPVVSPVG